MPSNIEDVIVVKNVKCIGEIFHLQCLRVNAISMARLFLEQKVGKWAFFYFSRWCNSMTLAGKHAYLKRGGELYKRLS